MRKPYAKFSASMLNNDSLRGESGYTNGSENQIMKSNEKGKKYDDFENLIKFSDL